MRDYKIPFYITVCVLMILCFIWLKNSADSPTTRDSETIKYARDLRINHLLKNFAIASSGVNFIDGTVTMINNINGEIVPPCKNGVIFISEQEIYKGTNKPKEKDCNLEIVDIDPDSKSNFLASLEASKKIINGSVLINEKKVPAKLVVQVTILYKNPTTYCLYVGGELICIKIKDSALCKAMGAALLANRDSMSELEYNIIKSALEGMGCVIS